MRRLIVIAVVVVTVLAIALTVYATQRSSIDNQIDRNRIDHIG